MAGEIRDRKMPRRVLDILLPVIALAFVSCGHVVYHNHSSLDDGKWGRGDTLSFMYDGSLDKRNTTGYELSVEVRTDASYTYKNLDVRVESRDTRSGIIIQVDTLRCAVFGDDGRRLGATAGMLYQVSSEPLYVPKGVGDSISFRLTHAMHEEELQGVADAGIKLNASSGHGRHQSSGR